MSTSSSTRPSPRTDTANPSAPASSSKSPHNTSPFLPSTSSIHHKFFQISTPIASNLASPIQATAFTDLYTTCAPFRTHVADWITVYTHHMAGNSHMRDRARRLQGAVERCAAGVALPPIGPVLLKGEDQDQVGDRDGGRSRGRNGDSAGAAKRRKAVRAKFDLEQKSLAVRAERAVKMADEEGVVVPAVLREYHARIVKARGFGNGGGEGEGEGGKVKKGCCGMGKGKRAPQELPW